MSQCQPDCILAVDVMGSDLGPHEVLEGVFLALCQSPTDAFSLILVGDRAVVEPVLSQKKFRHFCDRWEFLHASEVIGMDEKPVQSLRQKKNASMVLAAEAVASGRAQGMLSCGNTGSLVALGTIRLRPMEPLERPALATVIPALERHFILLDVGANPEPTPIQLAHNALLGAHYCRIALRRENPRVGLLSIGTEEGKGNELVQKTHEMLKRLDGIIDYAGLIEGFQLFENQVDVVVCDGFVGNILLKSMESMARNLKRFLRQELFRNPLRILGCCFASGALRNIKRKLSAQKHGGAPLLGLNASVFKAHGSSDRHAVCSAILMASRFTGATIQRNLAEFIGRADSILSRLKEPSSGDSTTQYHDK